MAIKNVSDPEFGVRMAQACDQHPDVPPLLSGRLVWIERNLESRFKVAVSLETVRKWYRGESRPRPAKMKALAALLEVDEAWLNMGVGPDMNVRERRLRDATVDGAVNVVAGFIQMCGGRPAFPTADDKRAEKSHTDIYAIIRGAQMSFHVSLAQVMEDGSFRFSVPVNHDEVIVVGVVPTEPLSCVFLELTSDIIDAHSESRGGYRLLEVAKTGNRFSAGGTAIAQIQTFGSRSMRLDG